LYALKEWDRLETKESMSNTPPESKCTKCGEAVLGKFCIHCGAPAGGAQCPKCQNPLSPGVKFCQSCGASVGPGITTDSSARLPWIIAAAAVLVAVLVVAVTFTAPEPPSQEVVPVTSPASGAAPDISAMGPREQADRLFDMIMAAAEQGDTARVAFHTTMAIQAYQMLGELDNDARYHVGLIHLVRGEPAQTLEQADLIQASVPGHLLAIVLRHMAGRISSDSVAMREAYTRFLANYESEIAVGRPEYEMHKGQIDAFLAEARGAVGGAGI